MENQPFELDIFDITEDGQGVGRHNGLIIFIPNAIPGDRVLCTVKKVRSNFSEAVLEQVLVNSDNRIISPCKYSEECSGCQLLSMNYVFQTQWKQKRVVEVFRRIGHIDNISVNSIITMPNPYQYRHNVHFFVEDFPEIKIGFYKRNTHQAVNIPTCYIHNPLGDQIYQGICAAIKSKVDNNITSFAIRTSHAFQKIMIVLYGDDENPSPLKCIATDIQKVHPLIASIFYSGKSLKCIYGNEYLEEMVSNKIFRYGPLSFFQINPDQAGVLFEKALMLGDLSQSDTVLDAYCGVGVLGILAREKVKKVVLVESNEEAARFAIQNVALNNHKDISVIQGTAENWLKKSKDYSVIIVDPPRSGLSAEFTQAIIESRAQKLIYISCNLSTLARDTANLIKKGYKIQICQPVDLFPQTTHLETILVLER